MVKAGSVKINNLPSDHDRFCVCRMVDGELWYWGSWDNESCANKAALTFDNGIVVDMGE